MQDATVLVICARSNGKAKYIQELYEMTCLRKINPILQCQKKFDLMIVDDLKTMKGHFDFWFSSLLSSMPLILI